MTQAVSDPPPGGAVLDHAPRKRLGPSLRSIRYALEYAVVRSTMAGFGCLSPERAGALGSWILRRIGPIFPLHRRALANLKAVLPDLPDREHRRILDGVWSSIGQTYAEYAHLHRFDFFSPDARVEIVGMETVERLVAQGRGGLFISGHFANWELMSRAMVAAGLPCATVVRPVNNPMVDTYLTDLRRREVCPDLIDKRRAMPRLVRTLRKGKFIAMLVDQRMMEGLAVPFLGRPAMTNHAPALLALKFDCPLIPAWIERTGRARYVLHVEEPIALPRTGDLQQDVAALTSAVNGFLETRIKARPEEWMWLHNRWKQ